MTETLVGAAGLMGLSGVRWGPAHSTPHFFHACSLLVRTRWPLACASSCPSSKPSKGGRDAPHQHLLNSEDLNLLVFVGPGPPFGNWEDLIGQGWPCPGVGPCEGGLDPGQAPRMDTQPLHTGPGSPGSHSPMGPIPQWPSITTSP